MESAAPTAYDDWKAPKQDGELVVWPKADQLLRAAEANHALLTSAPVLIQNAPLHELRRALRTWVGHADDNQLLIGTGHQTELYHPGVWVKHCLTNAAAAKVGGAAMFVAVDTDAAKHLAIRWPGHRPTWVSDDPMTSSAAWSGLVAGPTPEHVRKLEADADGDAEIRHSALPDVLASLRRSTLEQTALSPSLVNAMHQLDWSLGLKHHAALLSPMLETDTFLAFTHHLLADARRFGSAYNGALADYRRRTGTTNDQRPMPDLFASDESVESPLWLDDLQTGQRRRPSVFERDGGFLLSLTDGGEFFFDRSTPADVAARSLRDFLHAHSHRLAPRALTLTTFLRLLLVDQFVHGIGGGRYDQVTDRLITDYFGMTPPAFAVTTATMFLPQALSRSRPCMPCLKLRGHQLRHRALGKSKDATVAAIATAPPRSSQRRSLFDAMRRDLAAAASTSERVARWQAEYTAAIAAEEENEILFDRELFYALQPRERLAQMIARYAALFTE